MNTSEEQRAVTGPIPVGIAKVIDDGWNITCDQAKRLVNRVLSGARVESPVNLVLHLDPKNRQQISHEANCPAQNVSEREGVLAILREQLKA